MELKLKEKWLNLYKVAAEIGNYSPWNDFKEEDRFAYILEDRSKTVFFSFIADSVQRCGIACYIGENDYMRARKMLTSKNEKQEPVFMLQNAYICFWDNREDLSKEDYELIKELGFSFRGKGAWLHFDRYRIGYMPTPLEEDDIDLMTTALGNLHMMVRAIYEQNLNPEFDKDKTLVRWYEPKDKLYYTHPFDFNIPASVISRPTITVRENDWMRKVRAMKNADFSVELDWSYLDIVHYDPNGHKIFPRLILGVEPKSEYILINALLLPFIDQPGAVFNVLDQILEKHGKPAEIIVCDEDMYAVLADACGKVNIKLTKKKKLSVLPRVRQMIRSMM